MNQQRAENLYYYLREQNTPQKEMNVVIKQLIDNYNINLYPLDRRYRSRIGYSPNRYDINSYGTAGSRTMNQTRGMQKTH
ncbi:hypothetical protein UA38_06895 [Photobacterium kishitanii]|uniref:Uncharacterized protein n=3 Tax=Photobacterium TaxID=657 RepID=A0A1B8I015_9GAMM|nr:MULTISPECIES: hypothetical protein [Photobacterium]KJG10007.1 hypothetical protein UB40_09645 [Photobacterium kishitanii]KJG58283.1 hypothetical protein UA38_06895 [Photobacterium kishitanii]KJG61908.1 hypothetical protein UA42_07595 [Photobacterium kishitanii]KJG66084.1 hypothetical protein UA40_08800 [Photobacterium kishitanii]KJG69900.1 hypothetical protein UA41_08725 [Photobacterium kishitanii]